MNPTAAQILAASAETFGVTRDDITGPARSGTPIVARQVAMYLCRTRTPLSFPALGRLFHRDHTTVMHAVKKIDHARRYPKFAKAIQAVEKTLGHQNGEPQR